MAELVRPTSRVVGVDSSATMIEEARQRTEGFSLAVEYRTSDARQLDIPDSSFDAC